MDVGKEATVQWQWVYLHRVLLMRSHELCASAALDKQTSDATGTGKKEKRWTNPYFKMK